MNWLNNISSEGHLSLMCTNEHAPYTEDCDKTFCFIFILLKIPITNIEQCLVYTVHSMPLLKYRLKFHFRLVSFDCNSYNVNILISDRK